MYIYTYAYIYRERERHQTHICGALSFFWRIIQLLHAYMYKQNYMESYGFSVYMAYTGLVGIEKGAEWGGGGSCRIAA